MELYQPLLSLNWNMLFTAITVIVLFFILKHFFFEKVHTLSLIHIFPRQTGRYRNS